MNFEVRKLPESIEQEKDRIFDQYMKSKINEDFLSDFGDYFSQEEVDLLRQSLTVLDDETITSVISLPYELRGKFFQKMLDKQQAGTDLKGIIDEFIFKVSQYQYTIGYHTSPFEIKPDENDVWNIKGTEHDHRDDDRMMAYYSTQYRHLFKKKNPKFIYAVRSSIADDSHKTDGNWYRGDTLSVITKVPFEEVVELVEKMARKNKRPADSSSQAGLEAA